jgi:hypothetical protein
MDSLSLQIKDNFFTEKEYNILVDNLNKIPLSPMSNKEGVYSFGFKFNKTKNNNWLFDKIKNNFFSDKKLKVCAARFDLRHNKKQIKPHLDNIPKYNCIVYLKGEPLTYNGTGFYTKGNLNTYVGFVENRALFFNGCDVYHTDLQALGPSSPRYSLTIFYVEE